MRKCTRLCRKENILVSTKETTNATGRKVEDVTGILKKHSNAIGKSIFCPARKFMQ
jgi:hypothetical protein